MDPSADPHGAQTAETAPNPSSAEPRAPLGPSVTVTDGMSRRGMATVVQKSAPAVSEAFSSTVIWETSSSRSRGVGIRPT